MVSRTRRPSNNGSWARLLPYALKAIGIAGLTVALFTDKSNAAIYAAGIVALATSQAILRPITRKAEDEDIQQ